MSIFFYLNRKDVYGVYAEPVDPEEVSGELLNVRTWSNYGETSKLV